MKKVIVYFMIFLGFLQCAKKPDKPVDQVNPKVQTKEENPIISKGDYYFEFDEVTHYSLKDISVVKQVMEKDINNLSKEDQIIYDCYSEDYPKDLKNNSFLSTFDRMKYDKVIVDTSKYRDLNEVFREKKHRVVSDASCIPEYNDILVFRKKKKVIGLAKVCFGCMMNHILGTTKNTSQFGQSGDYERLEKVLNQ